MTKSKLSKRSAVFIIIAAAVVLAVIVLICSGGSGSGLTTTEKRVEYLASLGWDADPASETAKEIVLPETLGGVLAEYNELQKQQGLTSANTAARSARATPICSTAIPAAKRAS